MTIAKTTAATVRQAGIRHDITSLAGVVDRIAFLLDEATRQQKLQFKYRDIADDQRGEGRAMALAALAAAEAADEAAQHESLDLIDLAPLYTPRDLADVYAGLHVVANGLNKMQVSILTREEDDELVGNLEMMVGSIVTAVETITGQPRSPSVRRFYPFVPEAQS